MTEEPKPPVVELGKALKTAWRQMRGPERPRNLPLRYIIWGVVFAYGVFHHDGIAGSIGLLMLSWTTAPEGQ